MCWYIMNNLLLCHIKRKFFSVFCTIFSDQHLKFFFRRLPLDNYKILGTKCLLIFWPERTTLSLLHASALYELCEVFFIYIKLRNLLWKLQENFVHYKRHWCIATKSHRLKFLTSLISFSFLLGYLQCSDNSPNSLNNWACWSCIL